MDPVSPRKGDHSEAQSVEWVMSLSTAVQQSAEWGGAMTVARGRMMELLSKRKAMLFSDLSGKERMELFDELEVEVWGDEDYSKFAKHAAAQVEQALQVQALRRSNASGQGRSGREYISQTASEGAAMLLRRYPEGLDVLQDLGNNPLPAAIRRETWVAKLRENLRPLTGGQRALHVSDHDNEITALVAKAIKESGRLELEQLLPEIKSALSHVQYHEGGAANSPLIHVIIPMAWLVAGHRQPLGKVDGSTMWEALHAARVTTGHERLLDGWTCLPKAEFGEFSMVAGEALAAFDRELHTMLCTIMVNGPEGAVQMASGLPLSRPKTKVWDFATSDVQMAGAELGPLVLPLVQRLFVGVMSTFEGSCFVWDLMFLHGFELLPHLCACYLVCLSNSLSTALSSASNTTSLERTLNLTCGSVSLDAMQRTVEVHIMPKLRARSEGKAPSSLSSPQRPASTAQAAVARRNTSIPISTYLELAGANPYRDDRPLKIKVKQKLLATHGAASQTEASVSNLADPMRVLSPSHHSASHAGLDHRAIGQGMAASAKGSSPGMSERSVPSSAFSRRSNGNEQISSLTITYAGSTHLLRIPQVDFTTETLSSLADRMMGDASSERLTQAVIKLERQLPSFVARVVGSSVRIPRASNLDGELLPALKAAFPTLPDDYDRPVLRAEDPSHPRPIYIPSLKVEGKEEETVKEVLASLRLALPNERQAALVARLEEYLRVPGRGGLRDEAAERTPVGVTMTIDDEFGTMVGKEGDRRAARMFGDRARAEIAKILDCPLTCIEVSGVYRGQGIIVDFNIYPPEDSPRTARQLFSALSAMVPDEKSALHTEVQVCSRAVRVLLRGATHDIYERTKKPRAMEEAEEKALKDAENRRVPTAQREILSHMDNVNGTDAKEKPAKAAPKAKEASPRAESKAADPKARRPSVVPGGMQSISALSKVVSLNMAARDLQIGFANTRFFYSVGKERRGPVTWPEFCKLHDEQVVNNDSYVWYKALGKEWKKLSDNPELLLALIAMVKKEVDFVEKVDALREVLAVRIQRRVRKFLAARHNNMDYDEEEEAKNFTIAPEMPKVQREARPIPKQKTTPQPALPIVQKPEVSSEATVAPSQFMSRRVTTASIRPATKMQEVRAVQKDEEAMMLSLAGIMKTVRGMMKGSAEEQADIKVEMKGKVHKEEDQKGAEGLLAKPFLDGAMCALELLFMGTEDESAAIIRQKHLDQEVWDHLVSDVEQDVLGGTLEDEPAKRAKAWGSSGPKAGKLKKALEKSLKQKGDGIEPQKVMTIQRWQDALAQERRDAAPSPLGDV